MAENEKVINQTLLIWCAVVIVEIFVIASLMQSPLLVFSAFIMYWPIKAAMDWQAPPEAQMNAEEKPMIEGR